MFDGNTPKKLKQDSLKLHEAGLKRNGSTLVLSISELMNELHISRPTAYRLVRSKGFPSFTVGKKHLIDRRGLQEWIRKQYIS